MTFSGKLAHSSYLNERLDTSQAHLTQQAAGNVSRFGFNRQWQAVQPGADRGYRRPVTLSQFKIGLHCLGAFYKESDSRIAFDTPGIGEMRQIRQRHGRNRKLSLVSNAQWRTAGRY